MALIPVSRHVPVTEKNWRLWDGKAGAARQEYDHTDYRSLSHRKNDSGAEDARKIQVSVLVNRSSENGSYPQR